VAAAGVVTTFVFLLPPVFGRVANLGLRVLRRSPLTSTPGVDLLLRAVGTGVVAGLAGGISFWLILRSLDPTAVKWEFAAPVIGLYYASGLVGLLAVFAPAGIGVREGVLFVGLSTVLPTPVVITGAILMRLLVTGIDVAGAVAVLGLRTPAGDARTGTEPPGQGSQS
jgi:uncharacterized membrane protein YbhN (UPF0104 family)